MKHSLRAVLVLSFLLIAALGFTFISTWVSGIARDLAKRSALDELYQDANYLANSYRFNTGSVNLGELEAISYSSGAEIWIIDTEGNVLANSGSEAPLSKVSGFNPASGTAGYYLTGDFGGYFDEEMLTVYAPLTMDIQTKGYVLFHYPVSAIQKISDNRLLGVYAIYALMMILILFLFLYLDFCVISPVRKLRKAAREYSNGNLSYPSGIRSRNEIGDTAAALEELAKQLNSSSEDQHRFLANISHDFRSPLTSIRGYMTAIQDGTIPVEMQGKYIDVVLKETERLTKLANGLIDMTQLENGIILDRSVFDMNDLIREVLPTFEGQVTDKNMEFRLTFESEHAPVNADRQRIQQVLYNLVDNAVKFSPNDSTVDISTQLHSDKLFVSVVDHGVGIAKENLNKIWERFYKTDASRGKDRKGTGLGLAIVREIIQAHREHIDVISTPDVGTEFIFTLPSAEE